MGYIPEQHLTHLVVILPPIKMSFWKQQVQIIITTLYSIVVMNSDGIVNNIHHTYSIIFRQWYFCSILHFISTIWHLFICTVYKFIMVDLLIIQLRSILNGMIMNNLVINNNVLFQMSTVIIIFVFGDCNGCKINGNTIVGINIHTQSYIFILKRYLNNIKLINVGLIFCLISIFGDARTKLYLSKEYGNDNSYLVCLIDENCLEGDYITNDNIIYLLIMILIVVYLMHMWDLQLYIYMMIMQFKDMVIIVTRINYIT